MAFLPKSPLSANTAKAPLKTELFVSTVSATDGVLHVFRGYRLSPHAVQIEKWLSREKREGESSIALGSDAQPFGEKLYKDIVRRRAAAIDEHKRKLRDLEALDVDEMILRLRKFMPEPIAAVPAPPPVIQTQQVAQSAEEEWVEL